MSVATKKAIKVVQIIARVQFKSDARKVVYLVRGSHGEQYETYMFDGKATSCTCPAHKPCYHMTQLEAKESARPENIVKAEIAAWERDEISFNDLSDAAQEIAGEIGEHEIQIQQSDYDNLHNTMSREAYVACFDPCGLAVR